MTATGLLRRVVVAPLVVLLTLALVTSLPIWLLVATVLSPLVPGRWRPLRLLSIGLMYLVIESLMLVTFFVLWIASGFGWRIRSPFFQRVHYRLAELMLVVFFREARRVLRLRIVTEGDAPGKGVAEPGPLIVCCRHAGPGDSFALLYALLHWYDRQPRVVLKDTLAWDPMIDVLMTRLPARFVNPHPHRGADLEQTIGELARGLDDDDAFVIFPEGGNFTPARQERAVARLRRLGLERMAERAERMTHVLAPRPGGFLAALDAAPDADVVLVAHTGLDHLLTVGDLWRELPMDKQLIARWWRVPRDRLPTGREDRIEWLFGRWEEIDRWVDGHRPVPLPPARRRTRSPRS